MIGIIKMLIQSNDVSENHNKTLLEDKINDLIKKS